MVGKRIRKRREAIGFSSQDALAQAIGVDRTRVSRWESGRNLPTGELRSTLLRLLNATEDDIFGMVQNENPPTIEQIHAELKSFREQISPGHKIMSEYAMELKEERDRLYRSEESLRQKLTELQKQNDEFRNTLRSPQTSYEVSSPIPKEVWASWSKAPLAVKELCLLFLTKNKKHLKHLPVDIQRDVALLLRSLNRESAKPSPKR